MTTPTPDLLYIAGVVYPREEWIVRNGTIYRLPLHDCFSFNPRLIGSDLECKQALDCIVAAFGLAENVNFDKNVSGVAVVAFSKSVYVKPIRSQDILTAALLALMENRK